MRRRLLLLESRRFDRSRGVDTGGAVEPEALTVVSGDAAAGFTYTGTPPTVAFLWLRELPSPEAFTLVDLGSGKGRVLLLGVEHGFRRVIGVEFARELHDAARRNILAAGAEATVELVLGDAGAYRFPYDPLVVYCNNPFDDRVMRQVLENLERSYEERPRPIVVVYQQLRTEPSRHATDNLALLADAAFLTRRRVVAPRPWRERLLLGGRYVVEVFESAEAVSSAGT